MSRLDGWVREHLASARYGFTRLQRSAGTSAMTLAAIAIALTLPATLFTGLDNAVRASHPLRQGASISVYMDPILPAGEIERLAESLKNDRRIVQVELISPDEGLAELFARSGVTAEETLFEENPLPAVLVLQPSAEAQSPADIDALTTELSAASQVDQVRADLDWVRRIDALTNIARRTVLVAGTLLGLMVLLVVGNTIRLEIENRREEIMVQKLVGATNAFVRRPFLYGGLWLGTLGGLTAWSFTALSIALLQKPVTQFAAEYDAAFLLAGPGWPGLVDLILTGATLGWLGAWLAVGRHLRALEPE
jgi:cell division transport system permease protein